MKVAIVGAGVSGLAVAWRLKKARVPYTVFEKNAKVGGRVSTVAQDGFVWDDGATSIAPRGKSLEGVLLNDLSTDDLVRIEKPIWVHDALRVSSGAVTHNRMPRYTYSTGIVELANRLAIHDNLKIQTEVEEILVTKEGYVVHEELYTHLVLALPLPLTSQLLWAIDESRPLSNVSYRACISIMLGFSSERPDVPYHAIIDPEHSHPLTWLSVESEKSPGRAPEGKSAVVLQLSPRFSKDNFDKQDDFLISTALSFTKHLFGHEYSVAEVSNVKRWKYSQPENLARFEAVNQPGSKILVASDGLLGGRIEEAFDCGYRVAELLLNG